MKKIWYIGNSFKSAASEFIMLVKTDNAGTSGSNQFTIPTISLILTYNYDVFWEEVGNPSNNGSLTNQTGDTTITFASAGNYIVKISGIFPQIRFNNSGDRLKLLEVQNWGDIVWQRFNLSFSGCLNLDVTATDVPNLTNVSSFQSIFQNCNNLINANGSIGNWNLSNIQSLELCFFNCTNFNVDIGGWNVSNVTNMVQTFQLCTNFNQNIGNWNTSNVTNISNMFNNATIFNQDLSNWNVSNVNNFIGCFRNTSNFNQNLGSWVLRTAGVNLASFFRNANGMSTANYTDTLVGMINNAVNNGNLPINVNFTRQDGMTFDRSRSSNNPNFANAGELRDFAINTLNWDITSDTVIN